MSLEERPHPANESTELEAEENPMGDLELRSLHISPANQKGRERKEGLSCRREESARLGKGRQESGRKVHMEGKGRLPRESQPCEGMSEPTKR